MRETPRKHSSADDTEGYRSEVLERLKSIEEALMGNSMGTTGIVPRLARLERRQSAAERIYLIGMGICLALGALYRIISDYWMGHG